MKSYKSDLFHRSFTDTEGIPDSSGFSTEDGGGHVGLSFWVRSTLQPENTREKRGTKTVILLITDGTRRYSSSAD